MQMIKGSLVYTQIEPQGKTNAIQTLALPSKATRLSELTKGRLVNIRGKEKPVPCTQRQQELGQALKQVWVWVPAPTCLSWVALYHMLASLSLVPSLWNEITGTYLEDAHRALPWSQYPAWLAPRNNKQQANALSELPQGCRDQRGPWK